MSRVRVTKDEKGNPVCIETDNGFSIESRAFDPERDGWTQEQASLRDCPNVMQLFGLSEEVRSMFRELNQLRKENWELRQRLDRANAVWGIKS